MSGVGPHFREGPCPIVEAVAVEYALVRRCQALVVAGGVVQFRQVGALGCVRLDVTETDAPVEEDALALEVGFSRRALEVIVLRRIIELGHVRATEAVGMNVGERDRPIEVIAGALAIGKHS